MMRSSLVALTILFVLASVAAGEEKGPPPRWDGWCAYKWPEGESPPPVLNLPGWACEAAFKAGLHKKYAVYTGINPFYISGDFNADGRPDVALWITNTRTKQRGIAILYQMNNAPVIIGAGTAMFEKTDDYSWVDSWSVLPKGETLETVWEGNRKVTLLGDAIELVKSESSAHAIYWDGKRYTVYWLSD